MTTATNDTEIVSTVLPAAVEETEQRPINSIELRDKLFHQYLPLANKIACKRHKTMPRCVQIDELKSAAYQGLLDSATKYDEKKDLQFPMYARMRILGEI